MLIEWRGDVLRIMREITPVDSSETSPGDYHVLQDVLGCLTELGETQRRVVLREIDGKNSKIVSFIKEKEAVHPVRSMTDLKCRLGGRGRICFGLFHSSSRSAVPLAFVYIALLDSVPSSIYPILTGELKPRYVARPSVAVFYSITQPHPGLAGYRLGGYQIFLAIER